MHPTAPRNRKNYHLPFFSKFQLKIFLFFGIYFTFSLSHCGKKQNHLLFPPFLSLEIGNPQVKRSNKKFFFSFFFCFFHPTAPRNLKNCHVPFFFRNSDLKCPKITLSTLKFHFFTNYLFSTVTRRTHHLPTHTPFFRLIMPKNTLNTFYFELLFFPLYSFSLPPKHFLIIFSGKLTTKNDQKTSLKEENFFLFFCNLFHIFPLPLRK